MNYDLDETEPFMVGDSVEVDLGEKTIHGEIIYITDHDDFILKTKGSVPDYSISAESIRLRFPDVRTLGTVRGFSFCVSPGDFRTMDDFYDDYPETARDSDSSEITMKNQLGSVTIEHLRDAVHSYFHSGGSLSCLKTFENIRNGKSGFKSFMSDFKDYRYFYTPTKFQEMTKRAILTGQLDELFREESAKIKKRR